jgi:hypothetical protein
VPVIAKYIGVLAAADIEVFTTTTTFQIMQSLRSTAGHRTRSTPDRNAAGPGQRWSWCGPGDLRAGAGGHRIPVMPGHLPAPARATRS